MPYGTNKWLCLLVSIVTFSGVTVVTGTMTLPVVSYGTNSGSITNFPSVS
jgi:hypothetical protein